MAMHMTKIQKARGRLLVAHPFFATLVLSLPLVIDNSIPTMATDMKKIYYNEAFIEKLTVEETMFGLAHEAMHVALEHGLRLGARHPRLWNYACDYAINWMLKMAGFAIPDFAKIFGRPGASVCLDAELGKNSAEVNYEILKKKYPQQRPKQEPGQGPPKSGQGQGGGGAGDELEDPQDGDQEGDGHQLPDNAMDGDVQAPKGVETAAEAAQVSQQIRQIVAQAATMAKMAGKIPAGMERFITEILNPQVPWQQILREFMTRHTKSDETWSRRNRRVASAYLPARFDQAMGEIVIIGDSSGSIGQKEFNLIATEAITIAEVIKPESIRVIWADARIAGEQVFERGVPLDFKPKGGGGTDMRVPLKYAEQYDPVVVILITDGYTPWPDSEPPYPLIVCCTTDQKVPVGVTVRVNVET